MVSLGKPQPTPTIIRLILDYFKRLDRPITLGQVSLEANLNISMTEIAVNKLECDGLIKQLTKKEKTQLGVEDIVLMYVVVKKTG